MFRAELTFIRCTWQDSYDMYRFLVCFLINQLYQSCAMHHKSLIVLMQTILQDLSHLSPSVATVCVRGARCLVLPRLLWKLYWIPPSPKGKRFKCLCNYTSNNSAVHLGQANDKELQVSQSIEGLLIFVTCLSRWVGQQQRCLLTYVCVPALLMNSVRASVFIGKGGVCLRTGGENFTRSRGTRFRLKPSDREMRRDGCE